MKIIDLLNKIANGEEVPKRIKFRGNILDYESEIDYKDDVGLYLFNNKCCINEEELNEVVEIIEEKKMPDEININLAYIDKEYLLDKEDFDRKINEIINRHNILVDKVSNYIKSKGE